MTKSEIIIIFIMLTIIIYLQILIVSKNNFENYDYNKENPNALISGKSISGTVYSSYPENSPGLGWIL